MAKSKQKHRPLRATAELSQGELQQLLARPDQFGYDGPLPLFQTWTLGPVVHYEGMSALGHANAEALHRELEAHPEWEDQWSVTEADHWLGGSVQHLSFAVVDDDGRVSEIAGFMKFWFETKVSVRSPVADRQLYRQMMASFYADQLSLDVGALAQYLSADAPSDWQAQVTEALGALEPEIGVDGVPFHSLATMLDVAEELELLDEVYESNPANQPATLVVLRAPQDGRIVSGEILTVDSSGLHMVLFDDEYLEERTFELRGGHWSPMDDRASQFEIVSMVSVPDEALSSNPREGLAGAAGSWVGTAVGTLTNLILGIYGTGGGVLLWWTLGTIGAVVGSYMAADEDRKRRASVGAGLGNMIFPILGIGAALGGWIGGKKSDPEEIQSLRRKRKKKVDEYASNPSRGHEQSVRKIKSRLLR